MLIIRKLYRNLLTIVFASLCFMCTEKKTESETSPVVELDSAKDFYEQPEDKTVYNYKRFQGIYDHESTTKGFAAVLTITESGNDLSFTVSVAQGSCKGEAKGKISMASHEDNYYVGFFEFDECPIQFSLMLKEDKIDLKEVTLCKLHESGCAFEGTYAKRNLN